MSPDIDNVTALLREQRVWDAVKPYLDKFALVQVNMPLLQHYDVSSKRSDSFHSELRGHPMHWRLREADFSISPA